MSIAENFSYQNNWYSNAKSNYFNEIFDSTYFLYLQEITPNSRGEGGDRHKVQSVPKCVPFSLYFRTCGPKGVRPRSQVVYETACYWMRVITLTV